MTQDVKALPASAYFDQILFDKELRQLPRNYVANQSLVAEPHSYQSLEHEQNARVLVHDAHGDIQLLDNICKHRQAIMLKGRGHIEHIVCPLHRWTYNLHGTLIGAPHFQPQPCKQLTRYDIQTWQGMIFENTQPLIKQLQHLDIAHHLDFSQYQHAKTIVHECHYNWKTFIEVYLDDYHVVPFHPGLGKFVDCEQLKWYMGDGYSVQTVGIHQSLKQAGSPVYQAWHEHVKNYYGDHLPPYGAIWLTLYPNVMIEWYPCTLVVSRLVPVSPQYTLNYVEFYYPEDIVCFEPELMAAQQAAYMETCAEDDEIAERMDAGRKILHARQTAEYGPYQSPMEDGIAHFHDWYRQFVE